MLIQFVKPWRQFKVGHRTDFFTAGAADVLFRKGVAEEVLEPVAAVSEAPSVTPVATPATASKIGIRKPGK